MPEVGIYDSPEVNAFATGPSKKRALVPFQRLAPLMRDRGSRKACWPRDSRSISNGDMVTMTLLQGVINAFRDVSRG